MPGRQKRRRQQNPYGQPPNFNRMVRDIGNTSMGIVGIGAMTTVSVSALSAIKGK